MLKEIKRDIVGIIHWFILIGIHYFHDKQKTEVPPLKGNKRTQLLKFQQSLTGNKNKTSMSSAKCVFFRLIRQQIWTLCMQACDWLTKSQCEKWPILFSSKVKTKIKIFEKRQCSSPKEKGRDRIQSYDKRPYTHRKIKG